MGSFVMTAFFSGRLASRLACSCVNGLALLVFPAAVLAADVQVAAFTDTPDPVSAGGLVTYAARVDNSDIDAALDVVLRVSVPAGASFVSAPADCAFDAGRREVACSLGTVGGKGEDVRNRSVTLRALGPGPTTITSVASVTSSNDANPGNNSQSESTTVVSGANLGLAMSGSPNPVVGGGKLTYTLTASNGGPNTSNGIRIVNTLPPASIFDSSAGTGWSCGVAGRVVTCDHDAAHAIGALIPDLRLVAKIDVASGTVTNSATISPVALSGNPAVADAEPANNTVTVDTAVLNGADLRMFSKTVISVTPAIASSNVSFLLTPRNYGPGVASHVVVTDVLPAGWTFVSASGPNWTCSNVGATVSCSRATMPANTGADNITLIATAPGNAAVGGSGTDFTNTASLISDTVDPDSTNNSASVTLRVMPDGADLSLTKTKSPRPVALGSTMVSSINVRNHGPRAATGPLRVIDQLAVGEVYTSVAGSDWSCSATGATVVCDHPNSMSLAVGVGLPTLLITTTATESGVLRNWACTGNSVPPGSLAAAKPPVEGDANTSNDCAYAEASSTTTRPDLAITKTTSTPLGGDKRLGPTENAVTFNLIVSNQSPVGTEPATGIAVIDNAMAAYRGNRSGVPSAVATPQGGTTARMSCLVNNGHVNCLQTSGELRGGESITIAITMPRPLLDGNFANTATVSNNREGDPNSSNNTAMDTVQIDPVADMQMTGNTTTPTAVRTGVNATYVLSFRNNGLSRADGVVVTDTFNFPAGDSGMSVVSVASSAFGSSCSIAAGAQITPAANRFNCTIGSMADGETQTVTLVVRPNFMSGNGARSVGNSAVVSSSTHDSDAANNSADSTLTVNPAALDLLINKTDWIDPLIFDAGTTFIDYQVTVTNNGPSYGTGVRVRESFAMPAGKSARFVCDTSTYGGGTCNSPSLCSATGQVSAPGGTLAFSCNLPAGTATHGVAVGDLVSGQSKRVWLRFEVIDAPAGTGDVYANTASVESNEPDTQTSNDSVLERTTVRPRLDLSVAKVASKATVALNEPFVWNLTVSNSGPGDSLSTQLSDTLPAGMERVGAAPVFTTPQGSGVCGVTGQTVSCDMGVLAALRSATIAIPVRITAYPAGGVASNTASINIDPTVIGGIDPVAANNSATATVNVTRSSLAGTVFRDRDANGQPGSSGETGIAGVALTLTGVDAYGNPVNRAASTAADGSYQFNNLSPSNASGYTITETQPAAYVNGVNPSGGGFDSLGGTRPAAGDPGHGTVIAAIAVAGAATGTGYDFAEVAKPAVAGTVYRDLNNNGNRDAGETGVVGVTLQLLRTADDSLVATTVSAAAGSYSFINLLPDQYYLSESQPSGWLDGKDGIGQIGGAACGACTLASQYDATNEPATLDTIRGLDLRNGDSASAMDFGELPPASIAGLVFVDYNLNGRQDAGEPGLAGVTVSLSGLDDRGTALNRVVATDGSGRYAFVNLRPAGAAGYTVAETQPAGFGEGPNPAAGSGADSAGGTRPASGAAGFGTVIQGIALGAGVDATGYRFGEAGSSLVSGLIYHDRNRNGQLDAGEIERLAAQTVQLVDPASGLVVATTITDSQGTFLFANAPAGHYRLVQLHPAGYGASTPNTIDVTIPATGLVNQNFGKTLSSIAGEVFLDHDNNGVRGPQDAPISGATIELVNTTTGVTLSVASKADGSWRFDDLLAGNYTLRQPLQPANTLPGLTLAGSVGGAPSLPALAVSSISGLVLPTGTDGSGYRFAEIAPARVAGAVYLDLDHNGLRDSGESGVAGQAITLVGSDDLGRGVTLATTTDGAGAYAFSGLRPGLYTVTEVAQPAGTSNGVTRAGSAGGVASATTSTPSSVANIALAVGADSVGNDFGELGNGSMAGAVYLDANHNGQRDAGESGIAAQTIQLSGTDALGQTINRSVLTGADGSFSFTGLLAGTYQLTQPAQPAATLNGATVAGSAGGAASPVASAPSSIGGIVLAASASAAGHLFGEIPAASISGNVYNDLDSNGVRGASEDGYAGVRIALTGRDDLGRAVALETLTDAGGRYRFADLRPGSYTLTEPVQPAGTLNGVTSAGSLGGAASGLSTVPSAISAIGLVAGVAGVDYNFGEIGNLPNLVVSKTAQGVFATNNLASYRIRVGNTGQRATDAPIRVEDRLPAGIVLAAKPGGAGWSCQGAANDSAFECTSAQRIGAGAEHSSAIDVAVRVLPGATAGAPRATLNNAVLVSGGGEPEVYATNPAELAAFRGDVRGLPECSPAPTQNVCRAPAAVVLAAGVAGKVWFDLGSQPAVLDGGDRLLAGWEVEVIDTTGGTPLVVRRLTTAADGSWSAADLIPGRAYRVRFRESAGGVVWGIPVSGEDRGARPACVAGLESESCLESDEVHQLRITLAPGQQLRGQSLPVDPGGVVYDAILRTPVPGSVVTLAAPNCAGFDPVRHVVNASAGGYSIESRSIGMTVGPLGAYQFVLAASAPASCDYRLSVRPPESHRFVAQTIVPQAGFLIAPAGAGVVRVQPQAGAPVDRESTAYWLSLRLGAATHGVVHNHIPLDPRAVTGIVVSKIGSTQIVELGDSLQYTVRVRNSTAAPFGAVFVEDRLPAGFRFIAGTAQIQRGGSRSRLADPQGGAGPVLIFSIGALAGNEETVLSYRVRVGVGAQEGDGINRAQAKPTPVLDCALSPAGCSNLAAYQVKVQGGVFTTDTCIAGKVFVDCNQNHVQDAEELGIPGVRLWLQDGTSFITDSEGKYSDCGLPPRLAVIKLDPLTLPRGGRLATSSNRNAGDANSLFLDLRNGELHRADFIEGSCSNTVLEQVKARRAQGEVGAPQSEPMGGAWLRFGSKPASAPQQATDSADQAVPRPRPGTPPPPPSSERKAAVAPLSPAEQGGRDVR
ncbi:MAG: SdrD B-like domain-containing protein [Burkholderiaceae bacterium]